MAQENGPAIIPDITCQEIVQWVSAYLDDKVGDDRKRHIAVHLAICAGCETYVNQIATVRDLVGVLPRTVEQPSDLHRLRQAFTAKARRSVSSD